MDHLQVIKQIGKKIKIVVIDDSVLVQNIISDLLQSDGTIEVVATGKTGIDCIELAQKHNPDLITLDIEMPLMDGLTALKEMSKKKINVPIIMLSVLTQYGAKATFQALELGAIDFVPKPSSAIRMDLKEIGELLKSKIHGYFEHELKKKSRRIKIKVGNFPEQKNNPIKAVSIGTSTGGPNALHYIFKQIPESFNYPIFIVQHMPSGFTKAFAERLDEFSKIKVKEAEHGESVTPGVAYLAPGNYHMTLQKANDNDKNFKIELNQRGLVNGHRPSVDVTFDSLRNCYTSNLISVIMTGMGRDGADAIKRIKYEGGATIAQDEKTSVIFGMNRQAIESGCIDYVVPLDKIVPCIIRIIKERGN
ncbi:MAG: chemotaxis response regulator protein-glutamate methylesterase [Leptospiraceae bacterium]|nr:chemotaxis response regulator protein-glutamate methylesterase [Leptospiraceae bacterium]